MKDSHELPSPVYRSLRRLRYILPITAFLLVVVHQFLAHTWFRSTPWLQQFLWQVLFYGTIGPMVVWFALNWFARWVHERDEAEAHLRCLYQISRQAATATEMEALVEIALRMPEQIIRPVATSLILREHPESPWTLAGAHGLQAKEEEMLAARLTIAGSDLYCGQCAALSATTQQNCPLQFHLPQADMWPTATSVICLPLSTERPPLALLNVYVFNEETLSLSTRRVLESMAAVLSVALDHARLRAREFQMLHRMEQATRQRKGLAAILERILADIATAHRAQTGEVFLASRENEEPTLIPIASWPGKETNPHLVSAAQRALLEEDSVTTGFPNKEYVVAVPLMAGSLTTGVLVLAGRRPFTSSLAAFLRVAAGMMALIIHNSQLYAKLESQAVLEERNRLAREVHDGLAQSLGFLNFKMQQVDRLLARKQWEAAQQALQEMREGIQDLYTEVRLTIQDLRWVPEDGQRLAERLRQYVLDFGDRTGLNVSLDMQGEPNLSLQEEIHLFRIVQEALANVHKHAQAQRAWVRLRTGPEGTMLEVEDNGTGLAFEAYPLDSLSSDAPGHFGLRIMQERADAMGGRLSLHSVPGQGTRLRVLVTGQQLLVPYPLSSAPEGQ
jgi:signal transduction histidine kinase